MLVTPKELREQRAKLIADARKVYDTAEKANREPNAEERGQFDTMMADADKLQARFEQAERLEAAEKSLAESRGRQLDPQEPGRVPGAETATAGDKRSSVEYRSGYDSYLRNGSSVECRALVADNDAYGGALLAPMQTVNELIKAVDNMVVIRALATKFTVTGSHSLGAPSLENDPDDANWTAELATGSEDSTMSFGKRELHPHPIAKRIKLSNKLLRMVAAEPLVRERLAYKFGITEEKAFMTGDGVGKPLGVFTASNDGIPTSRDVATDNTATAITGDGLINCKYSLKQQYQNDPSLRWVFHRDAVKQIRKIKDVTSGQYIWVPGLQVGQADRLLDVPVIMSEYAPNTFTTGLYVGLLGVFRHYWIADALNMTVQRLVELYAESNQVGLIGRAEVDGMPVLPEAFSRVKLG